MSPVASFLLTLVGLSAFIIGIHALRYQSCDGTNVLSVEIPQCRSDPCVLKHNQVIQIKAAIKARSRASSIRTVITALIDGRVLNLPENNTDICAARLVHPPCPTVPGRTYTYTTNFKILKMIPAKPMEVTYKGITEGNRVVACAKMDVVIKKN